MNITRNTFEQLEYVTKLHNEDKGDFSWNISACQNKEIPIHSECKPIGCSERCRDMTPLSIRLGLRSRS